MEVFVYRRYMQRHLRMERVFRDRTNPFEKFNDLELFKKFRFRRHNILALTDTVTDKLSLSNHTGALTPLLQVMIALRYYASGSFQDVCGELIGVDQATVSRLIPRVTQAILQQLPLSVKLPTQEEADRTKAQVFNLYGFPNVFGFIDGTQIRIQAPLQYEHEFVNCKHYHALNVQVICDADLLFVDCIVKWPGSVHDARILRESDLFEAFESDQKPVKGLLLGDSGYMLRDWLFTPFLNPNSPEQESYNVYHKAARSNVERVIGILKRRWHCLRRLRLQPPKTCNIITVCIILHDRARELKLQDPSDSESEGEEDNEEDAQDRDDNAARPDNYQRSERVRSQAGKAARQRLFDNFF